MNKKTFAKEILLFSSVILLFLLLFSIKLILEKHFENKLQMLKSEKNLLNGYASFAISSFYGREDLNKRELSTILYRYVTSNNTWTIISLIDFDIDINSMYDKLIDNYYLIPSKEELCSIFCKEPGTFLAVKSFFLKYISKYSDLINSIDNRLHLVRDYFIYLYIIILVIIYPTRLLVLAIRWSLKTLKNK